MGNVFERQSEDEDDLFDNPQRRSPSKPTGGKRGRKRKTTEKDGEEEDGGDSPTRKITRLDTAQYVFERLFLQAEGSDVTVVALGHTWNLHKLYLQQSKYFDVLLSGDWKDAKDKMIRLDFPDENVTVAGLHTVLGSLYHNEIEIDLAEIEGVLAAASCIQLEGVLDRCAESMADDVNDDNVMRYMNCAESYGLPAVSKKAFAHLQWNFWRLAQDNAFLKQISQRTLSRLLSSSDLLVVEGEVDVYNLVKMWIYLQSECEDLEIISKWSKHNEEMVARINDHFQKNKGYIHKYTDVLSALRLQHLVISTSSLNQLERDALFPNEVVKAVAVDQWRTMLANEENPTSSNDVTDDVFLTSSLRLGRLIDALPKCWRWTGYNNGVDIVLNFNHGMITMKRNCLSSATPFSVNLKTERKVHYRLIVTSGSGKLLHDTGRQSASFRIDQSVVVARVGSAFELPVSVHLNYLAVQPAPPTFLYINKHMRKEEPSLSPSSSCSSSC